LQKALVTYKQDFNTTHCKNERLIKKFYNRLNASAISFEVYNISDNNYFKLRNLAKVLCGNAVAHFIEDE